MEYIITLSFAGVTQTEEFTDATDAVNWAEGARKVRAGLTYTMEARETRCMHGRRSDDVCERCHAE